MEMQDPLAKDSRLTKEALYNPSDYIVLTSYLVGLNTAGPSNLGVLRAIAFNTNKD
jgi:hypothetical protein